MLPSLAFLLATTAPPAMIASFEYQGGDVRDAVQALFKSAKRSYAIESGVKGTITLTMQNVSFDTLLGNILRLVNATYRKEDGLYLIESAQQPAPVTAQGEAQEVHEAIHKLFLPTAKDYVISPLLTGRITYRLTEVPWRVAVRTITSMAGARVVLVDGTYQILPALPRVTSVSLATPQKTVPLKKSAPPAGAKKG